MSVVWVIEKPKPESLISKIVGDFAIRGFASLNTLHRFIRMATESKPSLILVCVDDFEVLDVLEKSEFEKLPVIYLSKKQDLGAANKINGKQIILMPNENFLISRIVRNWLEKFSPEATDNSLISFRDIIFDSQKHKIVIGDNGEDQNLTLKESRLLRHLMAHAGTMLNRAQLREAVWDGMAVSPRTIDTHVSRLRSRLRDSLVEIESIYGGGYLLK